MKLKLARYGSTLSLLGFVLAVTRGWGSGPRSGADGDSRGGLLHRSSQQTTRTAVMKISPNTHVSFTRCCFERNVSLLRIITNESNSRDREKATP